MRLAYRIRAYLRGQLYSLGIHPWRPEEATEENFGLLARLAGMPEVAAIGEAYGVDQLRGGPIRQADAGLQTPDRDFRGSGQAARSPRRKGPRLCGRPAPRLCPRAALDPARIPGETHGGEDDAAGLRRLRFSFGEKFNPDALRAVPRERILAETDESALDIRQIIARLSEALGEDLTETIAANSARVFATAHRAADSR